LKKSSSKSRLVEVNEKIPRPELNFESHLKNYSFGIRFSEVYSSNLKHSKSYSGSQSQVLSESQFSKINY